jgi:hypothetical protein
MTDNADPMPLAPELAALSREAVLAALERAEESVCEALSQRISRYARLAGEELKNGRDYLALLTPGKDALPLEAVAMDIVRETFEEELAGCAPETGQTKTPR